MEAGPTDKYSAQFRCLFWVMMSPEAGKMFMFLFYLPKYPLSHHSVWATGLDGILGGFRAVQQAVVSEVTCLKTPGSLATDPATEPQPPNFHCFAFLKIWYYAKACECIQGFRNLLWISSCSPFGYLTELS